MSGAERSLLELITTLSGELDALLACPDGDLRARAEHAGIRTIPIEPLELGFAATGQALRRAGGQLVRAAMAVRSAARRERVNVVHAASTRAGLAAVIAAASGAPRPVVDVRDVVPAGTKGLLVRGVLRAGARGLVFNSEYTRRCFGATRPARALVAYPPVRLDDLLALPAARVGRSQAAPVLGVVGQITPWKGQDDAIRILALVRQRHPKARLRITGSVVFDGNSVSFDNEAFARSLRPLAQQLGVADAVEFAGQSDDLAQVFSSLDVLLVPSWAEPFGRVVAESMAACVPVVATDVGGPAELIEDGVTGFLAAPRAPERWVQPVSRLIERPAETADRIAAAARARIAEIFLDHVPAIRVATLYRELTASGRSERLRQSETVAP